MRHAAAAEDEATQASRPRGSGIAIVLCAAVALVVSALAFTTGAAAEQASEPAVPVAGTLDAGGLHTCSLDAGKVRCWGAGNSGQLGYGNEETIGDNETPGSAGVVDLGVGRFATAISAGDFHTCAVLDDGSVRCWGFGADGRLGYGNEADIGDDETPGSVGPVNIGMGRTATAISAGGAHTCAVLDNAKVLCWGFGEYGQLGYGDEATIGDDEPPGFEAPVNLGPRTATAISAGGVHTCALLDDRSIRCWGTNGPLFGGDGRLGYGNATDIGDDESPGTVASVVLGGDATAISAGDFHTCAVLDGGSVRCWGNGVGGRLGYAHEQRVGDNETPASVGPVALGAPATAITAGNHTCARLVGGTLRCWGPGAGGRLGYGDVENIGDNEVPGSIGPLDLGGSARAISAGGTHTCAKLADATLRCWGEGAFGRLGYGNERSIGDDEKPAVAGAVDLKRAATINDTAVSEGNSGETTVTFTVRLSRPGDDFASVTYATADDTAAAHTDYSPQSGTLTFAPGETSKTIAVGVRGDLAVEGQERFLLNLSNPTDLTLLDAQGAGTIFDDDSAAGPSPPPPPAPPGALEDPIEESLRQQAKRLADLRACRASAAFKRTRERSAARRRYRGRALTRALRAIDATAARRRAQCVKTFGRTPERVTALTVRRSSRTAVILRFDAAGTDGSKPPAAQGYLVKQSLRPIRTTRDFERASALCRGNCRFAVTRPGAALSLRVDRLRRRTTYYYAVAARDNVSSRRGPRSKTVSIRTG